MAASIAFLRESRRRDGTDDSVAVAQRNEIARNSPRHDEAVLDRLVAIAIAQRDLIATHCRHEDDAVRHGGAVGHAVGAVRTKYTRRISLVFSHRPRVIEQRPQTADADRDIGPQEVFAVVVEKDSPHWRFEKGRATRVAGCMPGVCVLLRELHDRRGQRRHHRIDIATDGRQRRARRRTQPCPRASRRTHRPSPSRRWGWRLPGHARPSGRWGSCRCASAGTSERRARRHDRHRLPSSSRSAPRGSRSPK